MERSFHKLDQTQIPTKETLSRYINSPYWNRLCNYIEEHYKVKPLLEYSGCSMQAGWNMKYKKSGRSLCTLYPMKGYYIVLVVIGERERTEMELSLPLCSEYLQKLYRETKTGMGQKWLMIEVTNGEILDDVLRCISIRQSKSGGSQSVSKY